MTKTVETAARETNTAPASFDYVLKQLRDRPQQIADLTKGLNGIGYEIAEKERQAGLFEAQATANAEGKNAEARKADAKLWLDSQAAYQSLQASLAELQLSRDNTLVSLGLARDVLSAAKAEARLLAAVMGAE